VSALLGRFGNEIRFDGEVALSALPQPLAAFGYGAVGEIVGVVDRSWARENSAVWEITTASSERFFLKRHPSARFHEREVTAYRRLTPRLGPGRAPELVAADGELLAIVVTGIPGEVAVGLSLTAVQERELHRQAGRLVRRIHDLEITMPSVHSVERIMDRFEDRLRRAAGLLSTAEVSLVRGSAARLATVSSRLEVTATHGDFQPRNLLWDRRRQRLALIDFERAELGPSVQDLVRMESGPWVLRPDLREAFLEGYGRRLSTDEVEALRHLEVLDALSGLQWGTEHDDPEVIGRARTTFSRMLGGPAC
jgi:Ser/Thr protein kinase RdoA (MazF antagonist)